MAAGHMKRKNPTKHAEEWMWREEDPSGFAVRCFEKKGRGIITTTQREKEEFLLVYRGECLTKEEGEKREVKDGGTGYRFFYQASGKHLCVDATEESRFLGRHINAEEEILYDYGIKQFPWETSEKKPQFRFSNCAAHAQLCAQGVDKEDKDKPGAGRRRGRGQGRGRSRGRAKERPRTSSDEGRTVENQHDLLVIKMDNTPGRVDFSVEVEYSDSESPIITTRQPGGQRRTGQGDKNELWGDEDIEDIPLTSTEPDNADGHIEEILSDPQEDEFHDSQEHGEFIEDGQFEDIDGYNVTVKRNGRERTSQGDTDKWEVCEEEEFIGTQGSSDTANRDAMSPNAYHSLSPKEALRLNCQNMNLNPDAPVFTPTSLLSPLSPNMMVTPEGHVKVLDWAAAMKTPTSEGTISFSSASPSSNVTSPESPHGQKQTKGSQRRIDDDFSPKDKQRTKMPQTDGKVSQTDKKKVDEDSKVESSDSNPTEIKESQSTDCNVSKISDGANSELESDSKELKQTVDDSKVESTTGDVDTNIGTKDPSVDREQMAKPDQGDGKSDRQKDPSKVVDDDSTKDISKDSQSSKEVDDDCSKDLSEDSPASKEVDDDCSKDLSEDSPASKEVDVNSTKEVSKDSQASKKVDDDITKEVSNDSQGTEERSAEQSALTEGVDKEDKDKPGAGRRRGRGQGRGRGRGRAQERPRTSSDEGRTVENQHDLLVIKMDNTPGRVDSSVEVEYSDSESPIITTRQPGGQRRTGQGDKNELWGDEDIEDIPLTSTEPDNADGHIEEILIDPQEDEFHDSQEHGEFIEDGQFEDIDGYNVTVKRNGRERTSQGDTDKWEVCEEEEFVGTQGSSDTANRDAMSPNANHSLSPKEALRLNCQNKNLNPDAPVFTPTSLLSPLSPDMMVTPEGHVKVLDWAAAMKTPTSEGTISLSSASPRSNVTSPESPHGQKQTKGSQRRIDDDFSPKDKQRTKMPQTDGKVSQTDKKKVDEDSKVEFSDSKLTEIKESQSTDSNVSKISDGAISELESDSKELKQTVDDSKVESTTGDVDTNIGTEDPSVDREQMAKPDQGDGKSDRQKDPSKVVDDDSTKDISKDSQSSKEVDDDCSKDLSEDSQSSKEVDDDCSKDLSDDSPASKEVDVNSTKEVSKDSQASKKVGDDITKEVSNDSQGTEERSAEQSALTEGKCLGSVVVVKGGVELQAFQMYSTVLAIGSARSNDIIVKNATAHEILIEVNRHGQIFLVDSRTRHIKKLQDNDMFEVGGRAFKWKLQKDSRDGENQDTEPLNELEPPHTAHTMKDLVPGSESDESEIIPFQELRNLSAANADSTIAEVEECEGVQHDRVMTVNTKHDRKGKHDYSKVHACIYCEKLDLKISRHLCSKHKDEKEIAQLPAPSKIKRKSQIDREHTLDALRNEGDFLYNIEVLKNLNDRRELIVSRRPEKGVHVKADYLPCKYCLRFYVKDDLWRHGQRCKFSPDPLGSEPVTFDEEEKVQRKMVASGMRLLHGAGVRLAKEKEIGAEKEEFYVHVLQALQDDSIGKGVKNDSGIMMFGRTQFERLGRRRAGEVRYRMRLLERIKRELRSLIKDDNTELSKYLAPDKFDALVEAVRTTVGVSEERSLNGVIMFTKPELAKKTGQLICKFAEMIEGKLVVDRDRERRQDVADFLYLYSKQWSSKIGSIAHQTSMERRFNKKQLLPLTEDLVKIQNFLDKKIKEAEKELLSEPGKQNWRVFANYLLTKITLFNFRRGNECAAMQVNRYLERADWRTGNSEIYNSLNKFECELAKKMDLVEVMGKQNRKVPVLLTCKPRLGIDLLISTRDKCGIDRKNQYVFAKGSNSFIQGCEALRYVMARIPDLERPEALKFPALRKYLATVVQVFGMDEKDLQEVARHMGHELAVHRKFYRLQDDAIELAKISKLLLAVENGKAAQYSGMSLDDLDLNDIPEDEAGQEEEEEEEVDRSMSEKNSAEEPYEEKPQEDKEVAKSRLTDSSAGAANEETSEEVQSKVLDTRGTQKRKRVYQFLGEDDFDSDTTCTYIPQAAVHDDSSDSSSDSTIIRKKVKRRYEKKEKKTWSVEEKLLLKPLIQLSQRSGKPPVKADVTLLQRRSTALASLPWIKIKHQVWAIAQVEKNKTKKIIKELKL